MNSKIPIPFISIVFLMLCIATLADETETNEGHENNDYWVVVHAGTLLANPGEEAENEKSLVIGNGRIDRIVDGFVSLQEAVPESALDGAELLDYSDGYVLPGLMDMHVHLSFESGSDEQSIHGASDAYVAENAAAKNDAYQFIAALNNAQKTLAAGYTTVRNVGSSGWHIFALRDAIADGNLVGPRIVTAGHTIRIGADSGSGACLSVDSCRRATREQIDMGAELIKVYATCSGGKPCGTEHAPAVFLEDEIRAVVETAATREMRVAAHAHGTHGINLAASAGVSSIEHGSYNDRESHRIMKRNGTFLVSTLAVQDNIREDIDEASGPMREVMQGFIDNHGPRMYEAFRAGVKLAAGSDAGVTRHGNNVRELELYVEFGLSAEDAIVAATVNAAALLNMEDELGSLQTGYFADFIVVDGNPLADIAALRQLRAVVKSGRVVSLAGNGTLN